MFRIIVRVLSILCLIGSIVIGALATFVYLTPSDEEQLYEQKHQEAMEKLQKAQSARGTPAEPRLAKEAKDAADSAEAWGRGYRERVSWNRLGVLVSVGAALLSFMIFLLTFVRRNSEQIPSSGARANQSANVSYELESQQPPNY
jgi:flagellar biosynthesis/type III secretory pathway M-ring protein FliF/YscJ